VSSPHCLSYPKQWKLTTAAKRAATKIAVKSFAREAALLVVMNPERAFIIFQELLGDIRRAH
jgi:hypothetical protein